MATLYERLGKEPAIASVVNKMYQHALKDPTVAPYFAKIDMEKQKHRQTTFLVMAFGGPNNYEGTDMKTAHKGMKLGNTQFNAIWVHLDQALKDHNVSPNIVQQIKQIFDSTHDDVCEV